MIDKLLKIVTILDNKFGKNENGRGYWHEINTIRKELCTEQLGIVQEKSTLAMARFRCDNSSREIKTYPTYVFQHLVRDRNCCCVAKVFSWGDMGIFSNDKSGVLLLKNNHFYNVWDHDFMFNVVDTPRIGKKRTHGSSS